MLVTFYWLVGVPGGRPLFDSAAPRQLSRLHFDSLELSDQTWLHLQSLAISSVARRINTFAAAVGRVWISLEREFSIGCTEASQEVRRCRRYGASHWNE